LVTDRDDEIEMLQARLRDLEQQSKEKDMQIASLRRKLRRIQTADTPLKRNTPEIPQDNYKMQYEALKYQYDRLREALAENGKVRHIRVKSAQLRKVSAPRI
jgi:chromosome segregation ATPase